MPKLERGCGATEARRNPSPTIGQAINGDFPWLECSRSGESVLLRRETNRDVRVGSMLSKKSVFLDLAAFSGAS
jgi:hypothetical protein